MFYYSTKLDNVEFDKIKADDNDSASILEHIKRLI